MAKISNERLNDLINQITDEMWNTKPEHDLIAFVVNQIEGTGYKLNEKQVDALTMSLTYITKATTKASLLSMIKLQSLINQETFKN